MLFSEDEKPFHVELAMVMGVPAKETVRGQHDAGFGGGVVVEGEDAPGRQEIPPSEILGDMADFVAGVHQHEVKGFFPEAGRPERLPARGDPEIHPVGGDPMFPKVFPDDIQLVWEIPHGIHDGKPRPDFRGAGGHYSPERASGRGADFQVSSPEASRAEDSDKAIQFRRREFRFPCRGAGAHGRGIIWSPACFFIK